MTHIIAATPRRLRLFHSFVVALAIFLVAAVVPPVCGQTTARTTAAQKAAAAKAAADAAAAQRAAAARAAADAATAQRAAAARAAEAAAVAKQGASIGPASPGLCPGLTGAARTACLQEEIRKNNANSTAVNAKLAKLNANMKTACDLMDGANALANTAKVAGVISPAKPLLAAGTVWTSVTSVMAYLTKTTRGCEEARQAVEAAKNGR